MRPDVENLLKEQEIIKDFLKINYGSYDPIEFYNFIFPNRQKQGEFSNDFKQPNPVYIFKNQDTGKINRRIMLKDTWQEDYTSFVECNDWAVCGGLSYIGKGNTLNRARMMNAIIIDLDSVGYNEFINFYKRTDLNHNQVRSIPKPTFVSTSGTGIHIYYVLEEPIELYPNIISQLKSLKNSLTFRIWDYKGTTQLKKVQYQSINQGFKMIGSVNGKYPGKNTIEAFKLGDKVSLEYLNQYVSDDIKVDLEKKYTETKYSLDEAKEKFPEWYQKKIVEKDTSSSKWNVNRAVYDWWKTKVQEITGGHRYFFLMCMAIYAYKCDIPIEELREDMYIAYDILKEIPHTNNLEESDVEDAIKTYYRKFSNFTIDDISRLTGIHIEKNKRNYRSQEQHLKIARAIGNVLYPNGEWRNLEGRPKKEQQVLDYIKDNPDHNPTQIAKNLGISRTTVYKYMKK